MAAASDYKIDLWSTALDSVTVDPTDLLNALEAEAVRPVHDFRTRVLLRDSFLALEKRWGERLNSMLSPTALASLRKILSEDLGEKGFKSLERRLMDHTKRETREKFLREIGSSIHETCRMDVGGSSALMLLNLLHRRTDDVAAVNEVPAPIRNNHELIENLITRYGLRLAHFQSHYLPDGWENRLKSFGVFGQLQVYLVDPVDIALGKLFSRREKDLDDLRALMQAMDKSILQERLNSSGAGLLADSQFRENAHRNWYILFGDALPA